PAEKAQAHNIVAAGAQVRKAKAAVSIGNGHRAGCAGQKYLKADDSATIWISKPSLNCVLTKSPSVSVDRVSDVQLAETQLRGPGAARKDILDCIRCQ